MKCLLLAWFYSDLIEVAKNGSVDANDDRSSVIAAGPVKTQGHSFSRAGVCTDGDVNFSAPAFLEEFITINASHIAEGVG